MSDVQDVFTKDGDISAVADTLGTGGLLQTRAGQESTTENPVHVGDTFLTEPLHAEFVALLEEASFVRQIAKTITMDQPTLRVPAITSGLQVYFHGDQGMEANETTMSAGDFTLEARKIMAQVIATAELYEDSQQNIEQIITGDFVRAIAQAEEQAFLLGRMTTTGGIPKGSINGDVVQDGDVGSSNDLEAIRSLTNVFRKSGITYTSDDKYSYGHWGTVGGQYTADEEIVVSTSPVKICDGVVTTALDEGNVVNMAGASFSGQVAYKAIREAIFKLGLLGRDRGQLVLVLNPVASNQLLQSDELMTLDKYGSNATILTGEVGSLFGVKIVESSFMPSDGIKGVGQAGIVGNWGKGGYGVLIHKPSLMLGDLRKVQVENERIIQNDAYRTVISERLAFGMERRNGAVAIGNIASDVTSLSTGSSVFFAGGSAPSITGPSDNGDGNTVAQTQAGQVATFNLTNLDVGEQDTAVVFSGYSETASANVEVKVTAIQTTAGVTQTNATVPSGAITAGTHVALSDGSTNLDSTELNVSITVDDDGSVPPAGAIVVLKLAVYDGSQYSNVHTYTYTVIA